MNPRPIGVFDSGVGGLTVFRALERALPHEPMIYLGDTARVPYGTKSPETVVRYSLEAGRFLCRHEVKMIVVACNTASSVAIPALVESCGVPVLGVILPGAKSAIDRTRHGRIGVIGTRATIDSGAYLAGIHALQSDAQVFSRACPLFVPLAEEGWTDDPIAEQVASRYLAPFNNEAIDTLVLGCTHYPLLRDMIGRVMGKNVELVDSAQAVAIEVAQRLQADSSLAAGADSAPGHHFFVTDVPGPFQQVAERFLGRPILKLECASLETD